MAHCGKFTRAGCSHMFKHYERAKDEKGEYIKFGNENIDTTKANLNYNLAPERVSQGDFVKQRCSEVSCLKRKDVNVMCSWVVTLPKEVNKSCEKEFFDTTYKFLEKRYGKENVVSAYVHNDEKTPHMHFAFVPVIYDKEKGKNKVSAKECVSRKELQIFHKDFDERLSHEMWYHGGVLNGATQDGNKSIEELKRQTAHNQLIESKRQIEKLQENFSELEKKKRILEEQIHIAESHVNAVQATKGSTVLNYTPKVKKSLTGQISMSENDYTRLLSAAEKNISLNSQNERLKAENDSLKKSSGIKEIERLIKKLSDKEEKSIIGKIKRAEIEIKAKKFDEISKAIEYNPLLQQKIKEAINRIKSVDELLNKMDNKNRGR